MLKLALCVAYGALTRTESRGAHFRQDYPRRDDAEWLKRTLATWKDADDTLPSLAYEPLDVMQMELPPGWRGYGAKDYIDHPDTARRAAEVEATRERALGRGALRRPGGTDAVRNVVAGPVSRSQRTHRRAAGSASPAPPSREAGMTDPLR